jgi:hypothetical protein
LPCYSNGEFKVLTKSDLDNSHYKTDNFVEFCKEINVCPAIDRLKAWRRISPPFELARRNDTQFYIYFIEQDEDELMTLNESELTSYVKLSPKEALRQYSEGEIIMVLPQAVTIAWISYFSTYESLKEIAECTDTSILSYLEMRSEMIEFSHEKNNRKQVKMFNEFDENETDKRDEL